MPSAREVLAQADTLMRRSRAGAVDTEIPELTEAVAEVAPVAPATPVTLADVPELTDAVEEIEITSIVEPRDDEREQPKAAPDRDAMVALVAVETARADESGIPSAPLDDRTPASAAPIVDEPLAVKSVSPSVSPSVRESDVEIAESLMALALPVAEKTSIPPPVTPAPPGNSAAALWHPTLAPADSEPASADNWARWEALGDEIRMQVLQRIELYASTGLREELSTYLQPIVDRASAQLLSTINEQVGVLLRAYVAQVIEREIEKFRKGKA